MNRKFRVTSLTAAALASLFLAGANLSNEVKADVNPEGTKAQAHSAVDNAKANVDSAQKEVDNAQADVDAVEGALGQAQSNAQGPNAAYAEQSGKTNAAKKDAADKANKLADAKKNEQAAEDLVKEATPSNIQSAKDAVKNQHDNVIPAADNAKRDADNAVANKKQDVATKETAVKIAQYNVDAKQNAKDQADHNVQVAEDALKETGIPAAQNAVGTYQKNVDNLNEDISHNTEVLNHNKQVLSQNKDGLKQSKQDLKNVQDEIQSVQNRLNTDNTTLKAKQDALTAAQNLAQSAAGFFKSLAEDTSLTDEQRKDAKTAYGIVMNDGKFQNIRLTWYDPAKQLGKEGDATSLSNIKAALNDLDDLVAVRQQYNLRVPKVSLTAVAVAMMSSDYLLNHDFDHPINHPENGHFFSDEEDIADGGSQVPLYMGEKQWIDDQIANHPEYAQYSYDNGHLTYDQWKANNEFWENHGLIMYGGGDYVIGHYTSMTNPYQDGVGMADANEYSSTDILADLNYKQVVDHVVNNPDGSETTYYNLIPTGVKTIQIKDLPSMNTRI